MQKISFNSQKAKELLNRIKEFLGRCKELLKARPKIAVLISALIVILIAAIVIVSVLTPEESDYSKYKVPSTPSHSEDENIPLQSPINFEALRLDNPEVCGWIRVDGTKIDYPILQSGTEHEEDYYLDRDLKGDKDVSGSIYIQKLNSADFSDPNTIIYGHNMLNGSMFAGLLKFRNTEFFLKNRYITLYTPEAILKYEIFSAFVYDDRLIPGAFDFSTPSDFEAFLNECADPKSKICNMKPDANVTTNDKIITLSTCTNKPEERYLVVASLIKKDIIVQ